MIHNRFPGEEEQRRVYRQALAREALELEEPAAIRSLLNSELEQAGLGDLVRAGH
jgi:hypothetical protein